MEMRVGLTALAAIVVAVSAPAGAQPPPASTPAKDFGPVWTGFYVGAAFGAGGAVNRLDNSVGGVSTSFNGAGGSRVLGSVYGGVDDKFTEGGGRGPLAQS